MKNYKMIPKITLWSLLALGIAFIALFFLGGSNGSLEVAGDFLDIPRFTDAFLIWNYILFGLVVLITLAVVCVDFANNWKTDRRKAARRKSTSSVTKARITKVSGLRWLTPLSMLAISLSSLLSVR